MRFIKLFFILAVALFAGPIARSQSCIPTNLNYSETTDMYPNQPANGAAPTTIYRAITLSGTATMPNNCAPQQVKHTARAYNQFNGGGGYTTGAPVCVSCFTTVTGVQQTAFLQGETGQASDGGDVSCTIAGQFFVVPTVIYNYEEAVTKSVQVGQSTNFPQYWKVSPWCSARSSPPDWNPNAVNPRGGAVYPYYTSLNICERRTTASAGSPWDCYTVSMHPLVYPETDSARPDCTNWDAGHLRGVWVDGDYFQTGWIILKTALGL